MIKYLIAFMLLHSQCLAGMGIGGFPYPGPGVLPITYTLTIDGTGWNGTDLISVGGSTYTADGTKTGLSGDVAITVTPGPGRTESCSGTGITGTSSPYTGGMTANRTIACTFSVSLGDSYDTFTGTDGTALTSHTSDSGHTWNKVGSGVVNIYSNKIGFVSNTSATNFYNSFVPTDADYSVFANIQASSSATSIRIGGRISSSANTGYFVHWNGGKWALWKFVNGTPTNLGESTTDAPTTVKNVELRMASTSIKVYIDSAERISVTDSSITDKGYAGVGSWYADNYAIESLDDWHVED